MPGQARIKIVTAKSAKGAKIPQRIDLFSLSFLATLAVEIFRAWTSQNKNYHREDRKWRKDSAKDGFVCLGVRLAFLATLATLAVEIFRLFKDRLG